MILLSSIIKAEYVLFENKNRFEKIENFKNTTKEELYEIYNQREIIIKEATDEASRIINTAKRNVQSEIAECKKRGYDEGYSAGLEIGKNKGYGEGYKFGQISAEEDLKKENKKRLDELISMLEIIEREKQSIISKYKNEIEMLSLDIAEKIIKQRIELKDDTIISIIEDVIKKYKNVEWVKIYISDKDNVRKIEADKALISELKKVSNDIKIEVSKDLESGSCIIETPDSLVDAGINTQLDNLREILLNK